jgi:hypothetical protein
MQALLNYLGFESDKDSDSSSEPEQCEFITGSVEKYEKRYTLSKNNKVYNKCDVYSGTLKDGYYDGNGDLEVYNCNLGNRKLEYIFNGEFQNNLFHGYGKLMFTNGDLYVGNFVNGLYNGYGVLSNNNNVIYDGNWLNGQMHGIGSYTSNGTYYTGGFKNGYYFGNGVLLSNDLTYTGYFRNGLFNGHGTLQTASGEFYNGLWENGYFKH